MSTQSTRGERPTTRHTRAVRCEKPGSCLSRNGDPIDNCKDAPFYGDAAVPTSEQMCLRSITEARIETADEYKRLFMQACQMIDEVLATPQMPSDLVEMRFRSIETLLERLIYPENTDLRLAGRLPFYLNARLLDAGLGLYYHRATHPDQPYGMDLMRSTQHSYVQLLREFHEGYYDEQIHLVAHNKIEIEIATLLGRKLDSDDFPLVALYREAASATRGYNQDLVAYSPGRGKVPIQIKNTHYRYKNGASHEETYAPNTAVIVHNDLVAWRRHSTPLITCEFTPRTTAEIEIDMPYEHFDPDYHTGIRWFVEEPTSADDLENPEPLVFVQDMTGAHDGLGDLIVAEEDGRPLTLYETNLLNAASHLFTAQLNRARAARHRTS